MFQFAYFDSLFWLLILPLALMLMVYGGFKRKKTLESFIQSGLINSMSREFSNPKLWLRSSLLLISILFLVLTLMRPQGNPVSKTVQSKGRDLVFVIDVSRSMLAEDLKPNRLGRAQQLVTDVVDILEGDRVGLLVFAGATAIKCPLTLDYNYFKNILSRIDPDDVNRGGTHIGDAIRMVSEKLFYDKDNRFRDIILITDGEDHKSFPIEAAESAAKLGIRIHTVGLGDPDGSNIPLRDNNSYTLLKLDDRVVTTKLDESTLVKIAEITQGVFIPVRTGLVDLGELYRSTIAISEKREMESKENKIWQELFQFFLGFAILALMAEGLLGERKISI